jgi:hypothetical protein
MRERATIVTAERSTDPYGADVPDWDRTTERDVVACVQPIGVRPESETMVERDEQRVDARIWLLWGTPITGRDRVRHNGLTFEVIGPPRRWALPWGPKERYVEADLRRVTGPAG